LCGGVVARDIEGWGTDIDVNFKAGSASVIMDDKGLNGFSGGVGPGIGGSMSATYTTTITLQDMWNWAQNLVH
jgi:hypothetical protein